MHEIAFAATAPLQIGIFTARYSERLIDLGAYTDGTAISFTNFQITKI